MLQELKVKNFALIKSLSVQFHEGLNVLTGETGAGKSLVLKSLQMLMGGKAPSNLVGNFGSETIVEGLFKLDHRPDIHEKLKSLSFDSESLEEGEAPTLLVRRIINNKGRSRTYLNGSLATVTELRKLVSPLVELAGSSEPLIELTNQHDNKNLQSTSYQRDLFDLFCKNKPLRQKLGLSHRKYKELNLRLEELKAKDSDRLQKLDFLNFQLSELNEFQPNTQDYFQLKENQKKRATIEKNKEHIFKAQELIQHHDHSILSQLFSLQDQLETLEQPELLSATLNATDHIEKVLKSLEQIQIEESEGLSFEEIQGRLQTYEHLFRKYNTDAQGLSDIYTQLNAQKEELELIEDTLLQIQNKKELVLKELAPLAKELSLSRNSHSLEFESRVLKNLEELNMKDVILKVKLTPQNISEYGTEEVSFWLHHAKHPGQERSIKKFASGGELSRLLLSIKTALESQEAPRTYLFDEIDAGVSGPTADKVGKKLASLAQGQQVVTITHLPQVAAAGAHHFIIEKTSGTDGHQTELKPLDQAERTKEIARLISGVDLTDSSLRHACELLNCSLSTHTKQ